MRFSGPLRFKTDGTKICQISLRLGRDFKRRPSVKVKRLIPYTILGLTLLCLFLVSQTQGVVRPESRSAQEEHEVTVRLVLVDVIATDKDGNIVTDLTMQDFEIFEGGKPVSINSLDLVNFRLEEIQPTPDRGLISRKSRVIVVFDSINTIRRMLNRDKDKILEKLMDLIRSGGEVLVLEMKEKGGVNLLQPFTSNENLIAQAVEKASGSIWVEKATEQLGAPAILSRVERTDRESFNRSAGLVQAQMEMYQYQTRLRFEKSLSGLLSVMSMIKDYPGRKPVLMVSGGFPTLTLEKFQTPSGITSRLADTDLTAAKIADPFKILQKGERRYDDDIFSDLMNFANSHNITFYTMDPDSYLRYVLPDMTTDNFTNVPSYAKIKQNELFKLKYIAQETGGEALQGAKKFDDFSKYVNRDLQAYYELSYYPSRKNADGKYHKIEVKVKRPDVKIRFRKGYHDYNADQAESLLFASTSANPDLFKAINFQARAVPFVTNKDKYIFWFTMALPVQDLVLSPDPSKEMKILKVNFWLDDREDANAFNARMDIPVVLSPQFKERLKRARFYGHSTSSQELKLKKPEYRLVYALYDEESGRVGTTVQNLVLPVVETLKTGMVANAVFGRMREAGDPGGTFKISPNDGTLGVGKYKFYPMGANQFSRTENVSLFVQVKWPDKKADFLPELQPEQSGQMLSPVPYKIEKTSWNRRIGVMNAVLNLDFSQFSRGDYTLRFHVGGEITEIPIRIL